MSPDKKSLPESLVVSPKLLIQHLDGESVLLDMNTEKYFGLNQTGTVFLKSIQENGSVDRAIEKVLSEFDTTRSELEKDLLELIGLLIDKKLVS